VNVILVAADALVANDADVAILLLCAQLLVPMNSPVNDPLKLPVFICNELDTVPLGRIVGAYDAEVANEAVDGINVMLVAADAVVVNEDDTAILLLCAQLLVPMNSPVNDPLKLPVLICVELDTMPLGTLLNPVYDT
jgi:hypothetical protein